MIERANEYTKEQLYEAYSLEAHVRKDLNKQLNKERKAVAAMKFDAMYWQDAFIENTVRYAVECEGDVEEALDEYFAHPNRHVAMTKNKGFYAFVDEGDYLFIVFAYTNPKEWKSELKDMSDLIKEVAALGKPIRWTGTFNVLRNHSVEIEAGLWELKL